MDAASYLDAIRRESEDLVHPIDPALAADGVDEFLELMATDPEPSPGLLGRTILLSCTDGQGDRALVEAFVAWPDLT